jgi:8-oxo-dGTP pyrophosphatase MutT (NUDIX family)
MVRYATTILLVRDGDVGLEVFMVQRHRRSGFLPNAWVFPGGRVDDADRLEGHPRVRGGDALLAQLGLDRNAGVASAVAGVRETFEEAGIWLGQGGLPAELRDPLARGELKLGELLDAHDASLDLDRLVGWSWWLTPKAEPKRYDTRFLIASVPEGGGAHDERETVDSRWVSPSWALGQSLTDFPLAPPTWWTLRELEAHADADRAIVAARARRPLCIQPVIRFDEKGIELLFPGHPEHPDAAIDGLPHHMTYVDAQWRATRDNRPL